MTDVASEADTKISVHIRSECLRAIEHDSSRLCQSRLGILVKGRRVAAGMGLIVAVWGMDLALWQNWGHGWI
jgi:hypothetical protein